MTYHQSTTNRFFPILTDALRIRTILQRLQHRNLPKHQMESRLTHPPDHVHWRLPHIAPAVEGTFITPGFQHHHGCRIVIHLHLPELFIHLVIAVPAIGTDPYTKDPLRRQHRFSRTLNISPQLLCRTTQQYMIFHPWMNSRSHLYDIAKAHCYIAARTAVETKAAICQEQRNRQIAPLTLLGKMLHHLTATAQALLIHRIKAFARTIHMLIVSSQRHLMISNPAICTKAQRDLLALQYSVFAGSHRPYWITKRDSLRKTILRRFIRDTQCKPISLPFCSQEHMRIKLHPALPHAHWVHNLHRLDHIHLIPACCFLSADKAIPQMTRFLLGWQNESSFTHTASTAKQALYLQFRIPVTLASQADFFSCHRLHGCTTVSAIIEGNNTFRQVPKHPHSSSLFILGKHDF